MALITGANKGIGFEIASQLGKLGWQVVLTARRTSAGKEAAARLATQGASTSFQQLDVADPSSVSKAATEFGNRFKHLDVLINNAGIYPDEGQNILSISLEQMETTLRTNALGALAATQAFLPYLRQAKTPRVINMSSGYGQLDSLSPEVPSYCLSKLALNGVTLLLSRALANDGVSVNSMSPGWVRTDMGGANAPRSVEQGADTAVWLATEAPHDWTGKFLEDRKEIPW